MKEFTNFDYKIIEEFPRNTYVRQAQEVKKIKRNRRHDLVGRIIGGSIFMGILIGTPWLVTLICDAIM